MGKILTNKEALQAILEGKIVKNIQGMQYKYNTLLDNILVLDKTYWVKANHFNDYNEFTLVEKKRDAITLYEHISNFGEVSFLTDDKRRVIFGDSCNELTKIPYSHKVKKLYRNGVCQEVKVWADTLEYVGDRE